MFIAGGNSKSGSLKDVWRLDLEKEVYYKMKDDMPGNFISYGSDHFIVHVYSSTK